jgi:hypothetical protein
MTPTQLKALQRYISAVAYFMTTRGDGGRIVELRASRKHLEDSFGCTMPNDPPPPAFPEGLL